MMRQEPRLYLVSRPGFDVDEFLRFVEEHQLTWRRTEDATSAEEMVEAAGRVCYMSFGPRQSPRTTAEYIQRLIQQGHESVLEHVAWGFILTGVTRAFTHQFVRHRVGFAFSQLSQQYRDQRDAPAISPRLVALFPEAQEIWQQSVQQSQESYRQILDVLESGLDQEGGSAEERRERHRAIRSSARSVLPEATESKVFFSANARAIRHFLTLRGGLIGDEEMRVVSAVLLRTVSREAPSLFADFREEEVDGLPVVRRLASGDL
jgi:thymidylate synthase (FAD)